ncbi:nucleotide exchange factor GrpE [Mycolicibacterium confluentis]|uniref:Protein GrpE n=1 Tax=Mycolicibacterium confluentis TaxID=28047 RepID=A0A7I7Y3C7_9MYCO|nr:nucleotide exchange factor GrpE [Mycolicibacterium confluentis]MCV7320564.1 nucleotide exchange factor GrpE [Mycolicibacterium confluentis]ORV30217.1 molecular chaperone GrpE [Mycolicibacterium confluentis]BBZ35603.1 protein GrpE [Mycolicibacterium confluentis]
MSERDSSEPVTVTDKRRLDPETGEVRDAASAPAPSGPEAEAGAPSDTGEVADLKSTLQRVKAEYDNYRKRSLRQEQAAGDRAKASVVSQLLPILDDLDRARSHGDLETGPLKAVADKLTATLEGLGLSAFGAEGDEFDPALHEAVQHEGDGANPVIGTVMRQGYRLGEQVLRHAMVGVVDSVGEAEPADTADNAPVADQQAPESE